MSSLLCVHKGVTSLSTRLLLYLLTALIFILHLCSNHGGSHALMGSIKSRVPRRSSTATLQHAARKWSRPYFEDDDDGELEKRVERPTQTKTQTYSPSVSPAKPKIVVLGASGKIGRLVVAQLMELSLDCTIVALVHDYNAASRIFFKEGELSLVQRNKGPQLQIMEADLVPDESLPGYNLEEDERYREEEVDWKERAESAAKYYNTSVQDFDNRNDNDNNPTFNSLHEILESAVRDCTCIISCVGSVRPTNLWTDLLQVPLWRLLQKDVSGWCRDKRHPYYVHYTTTRQVLGLAEREQRRRQALAEVQAEDDLENSHSKPQRVPRIRLVRISDLCVAQRAWEFVPLITNALHSMVFQYQDMAERILEESNVVDTVVLRPGDLMDDEREVDTTSLQVDCSGRVPSPARVGRSDVAAVAVACALFTSNEDAAAAKKETKNKSLDKTKISEQNSEEPFHYTLGVRWAGQDLHPYPPQGHKSDGLANARQCIQKVLKTEAQKQKRRRRLMQLQQNKLLMWPKRQQQKRKSKPYGLVVALFSYTLLGLFVTAVMKSVLAWVPGGESVLSALEHLSKTAWGMVGKHLPFVKQQTVVVPPRKQRIPFQRRPGSKSHIKF